MGLVMAKKPRKRKTQPRPVGRPTREFTRAQVARIDQMAEAQCKDTTIAQVLGVDLHTFREHFLKRTQQKRDEGKSRVLEAQYHGALKNGKGAVTERIWFGKQHLEQTDRQEIDHSVTITLNDAALALGVAGRGASGGK
jgi:hypothetical protein